MNQDIDVTPYQFNPEKHYISSIVLEIDFFNKKNSRYWYISSIVLETDFFNKKNFRY